MKAIMASRKIGGYVDSHQTQVHGRLQAVYYQAIVQGLDIS